MNFKTGPRPLTQEGIDNLERAQARSSKREVRNPVLALPAVKRLQAMDPATRAAVAEVFKEIQMAARANADKCWRTHKGPMAVYWKATGVYAGHFSRAVRSP